MRGIFNSSFGFPCFTLLASPPLTFDFPLQHRFAGDVIITIVSGAGSEQGYRINNYKTMRLVTHYIP